MPVPFFMADMQSSVGSRATWSGCAGKTGTPILDVAHESHLFQPETYVKIVEVDLELVEAPSSQAQTCQGAHHEADWDSTKRQH